MLTKKRDHRNELILLFNQQRPTSTRMKLLLLVIWQIIDDLKNFDVKKCHRFQQIIFIKIKCR